MPQCADGSNSGQGHAGWKSPSTSEALSGQNRQSERPVAPWIAPHASDGASHSGPRPSHPQGHRAAPRANAW